MGHVGRWRQFTGFGKCERLLSRVAPASECRPRQAIVGAIAGAARIALDQYIHLHTLWPFETFHTQPATFSCTWVKSKVERARVECLPVRPGAYLCSKCVKEDDGYWGYSYWRRDHQMPGRMWCQKHPEERLRVVHHRHAFSRLPGNWERAGQSARLSYPEHLKSHPHIHRFHKAADAMLDAGPRWTSGIVGGVLRVRAQAAGIAIPSSRSSSTTGVPFRAFVLERIPQEFVDLIRPDRQMISGNGAVNWFDGPPVPAPPCEVSVDCALLIALLFENVEEAFSEFANKAARARVPILP